MYGRSRIVDDEIARVESIGGWIADGRVCDILAVSRAFGDPQFKGDGLQRLLKIGIECASLLRFSSLSVQSKRTNCMYTP